jgi:hypothetical protein
MSFLAANRRELRRANFKNQVGKHLAAFYACELPIVANEQESTSPLGKRSKKRKSFRIDHGRLVKHEEPLLVHENTASSLPRPAAKATWPGVGDNDDVRSKKDRYGPQRIWHGDYRFRREAQCCVARPESRVAD